MAWRKGTKKSYYRRRSTRKRTTKKKSYSAKYYRREMTSLLDLTSTGGGFIGIGIGDSDGVVTNPIHLNHLSFIYDEYRVRSCSVRFYPTLPYSVAANSGVPLYIRRDFNAQEFPTSPALGDWILDPSTKVVTVNRRWSVKMNFVKKAYVEGRNNTDAGGWMPTDNTDIVNTQMLLLYGPEAAISTSYGQMVIRLNVEYRKPNFHE